MFWLGIAFLIFAALTQGTISTAFWVIGGSEVGMGIILLLSFPRLIRKLYSGKAYGHQPWLFGLEGHATLEQIEHHIWHIPTGRLQWSPYGSPLSTHRAIKVVGKSGNRQESTHVEGVDPLLNSGIRGHVTDAEAAGLRVRPQIINHSHHTSHITSPKTRVLILMVMTYSSLHSLTP